MLLPLKIETNLFTIFILIGGTLSLYLSTKQGPITLKKDHFLWAPIRLAMIAITRSFSDIPIVGSGRTDHPGFP